MQAHMAGWAMHELLARVRYRARLGSRHGQPEDRPAPLYGQVKRHSPPTLHFNCKAGAQRGWHIYMRMLNS